MNSTDHEGHRPAPVTRRRDAIVVGARCAGAATAMLLARKGYDVLLVDRARFPSDTVSTHVIHPPGLTALRRWGLLDDLVADRLPVAAGVHLRLRAAGHHRDAARRRRHRRGLRAAPDRAGRTARPRRPEGRRRAARGVQRRPS